MWLFLPCRKAQMRATWGAAQVPSLRREQLPVGPEAGTQTVEPTGPLPIRHPKKVTTRAHGSAAPTLPDSTAAVGRERCHLPATSLSPSSSQTLDVTSAPPTYNALPFMAHGVTPGPPRQELLWNPKVPELQTPRAAMSYCSPSFAMAMMAAAMLTPHNWWPQAAQHCPTCSCSSHRAGAADGLAS